MYRRLQAAYEVLVFTDSRHAYDTIYRNMKGLPPPPPLGTVASPGMVKAITKEKAPIQAQVEKMRNVFEPIKAMKDETATSLKTKLQSLAPIRADDPHYALKKFSVHQLEKAMLGRRPYWSYIPILTSYDGKHTLKCSPPKFVGSVAHNSLPK
jgi:hypothetical protein